MEYFEPAEYRASTRKVRALIALGVLLFALGWLVYTFRPAKLPHEATLKTFVVKQGDGFHYIADRLEEEKLIRSAKSFKVLAIVTGSATRLKPGEYELSARMSTPTILGTLVTGKEPETEVTIREGASFYEIDKLLSEAGVIRKGAFANAAPVKLLEGKFFPDSYRFFYNTTTSVIIEKLTKNFELKAGSILPKDPAEAEDALTLASILEKEVPEYKDRQVVAGILKKRIKAGVALQVDASICYLKELEKREYESCGELTALDLKIDSPYNTYLVRGLPPGPIGNPGAEAIRAAITPAPSPYWYYLNDPKTKKTHFAETLDEHIENKVKYLR